MHPDHDPTPGISASMTVGELVRLVDPHDLRPEPGYLAVETTERDPDLDAEIMQGVGARRLPFILTGITGAAGWGAWAIAETAATPDARSAVVVGTVAVTAIALPVLRGIFRHRIPESWRRRWWLTGIPAAGWVDVAAVHGPDSWAMTGVLVVGGAALSARWWAEWEVPNPGGLTEPEPVYERPVLDMSRAAQIEQAWTTRVAGGRNPVAGRALLTGRTELPNGTTQWVVELDPEGSVGATEFITKSAPIARALRMKASNVIAERLPGDDDREDRALLTIVTRDLLSAGVPYHGPRYHDGLIPVGMYADGAGEADYIAVDEVGARSGLVTGDPGSGKTALLEAIVMGKLHSGVWKVLFGDGDPSGGSSPTLNRIADWAEAGPEGVLRQLRAVEALIKVRSRLKPTLAADGHGGLRQIRPEEADRVDPVREMRPCRQYPGYVLVLDELQRLSQDDTGTMQAAGFIARLEKVLRIGRKYGVVVVAGTQSLNGGDYGGSTQLRAYLAARNAFVMRSTNRSEQHALNGIDIAPGSLPPGGGYAFVVGGGRMALMRVAWSETMSDYATKFPECPGDPDSEMATGTPAMPWRPASTTSMHGVPRPGKAATLTTSPSWKTARKARAGPQPSPPPSVGCPSPPLSGRRSSRCTSRPP